LLLQHQLHLQACSNADSFLSVFCVVHRLDNQDIVVLLLASSSFRLFSSYELLMCDVLRTLEDMYRVLLCMLEAVEDALRLLEVFEVLVLKPPEVQELMRCVV